MKLKIPEHRYTPVILSLEWTADLYRIVIISVAPGRRLTCIVGPVGASDEQVRASALALLAYIT